METMDADWRSYAGMIDEALKIGMECNIAEFVAAIWQLS